MSLPVVILSSDKYSDVLIDSLRHVHQKLDNRFSLFYSVNSSECAQYVANFLPARSPDLSESIVSDHAHIYPLFSGTDDWTDTLRCVCRTLISHGYERALFALEDFFVVNINNDLLAEAFRIKLDLLYVAYRPRGISVVKQLESLRLLHTRVAANGILRISSVYKYGICLQPAIWNLSVLLEYLNKHKPASPWDFERPYLNTSLRDVFRLMTPLYVYSDQAIEKGMWFPLKALLYRRHSDRPIMPLWTYLKVLLRTIPAKTIDSAFNFFASRRFESQ